MRKARRRRPRPSIAEVLVQRTLARSSLCLSQLQAAHEIPDTVLEIIGGTRFCEEPASECTRSPCRVRKQLAAGSRSGPKHTGPLFENLVYFKRRLKLTIKEQDLLATLALIETERPLTDLYGFLCTKTGDSIPILAWMLDLKESEVREIIDPEKTLMSTGVVRLWPIEEEDPF